MTRSHFVSLLCCILLFLCCCHKSVTAAITPNGGNSINSDLVDKMSWKCANNASCLYTIANSVLSSYRRGDMVQFGVFDLVKLPPQPAASKTTKTHSGYAATGRGTASGVVEFLSGNAIRIPIGPMVFSVQRDEEDADYIEVALLKKASQPARRRDAGATGAGIGRLGDGGSDGGLLGGGGGGLLGGGGNKGGRIKQHQDKKQFQMLIPMYLAATTFGWTVLAAKAVGLLTLKALAVSKLALIVAATVIIKKMMDGAGEKMMYQFPEHTPYMMPYNMDYGMHAMGGGGGGGIPEISTSDMYQSAMHMGGGGAGAMHVGHPGLESLGAESNLHQQVSDVQNNNTQMLAALNAAGLSHGAKVKREDSWLLGKTRRPFGYNYPYMGHRQ